MARRLRRRIAAAVLAGLGLALASPLALAFEPEKGGCCRGRCCCPAARPDGGPCVRAACRCGGDGAAVVPTPTLDEGLLPPPVPVGEAIDAGPATAPLPSVPSALDLAPPDHPPPFSLSPR
jgi:hypothetical protein